MVSAKLQSAIFIATIAVSIVPRRWVALFRAVEDPIAAAAGIAFSEDVLALGEMGVMTVVRLGAAAGAN
jgi:hypothetical protein